MEDKEVKDKTVPVEAPEKQKDLKKPTGKSATGKPLDGIDINPQLNDVSTDGNQLKIRKEDSVDLTAPVIQERKALTLPQRQKRARSLRANERKMERAREIAKAKLAPSSKIEQRALSHARAIVKKRFAARKGTPYAELTTTEKIQVDTAVAKKTKLIQKIAKRLLPRIRKAEYERLKSFRSGAPLQDLSTQNPKAQGIMPKVTEEMSQLFNTLDAADTNSLISIIEDTINQFNRDNNPLGDQLKRMLDAVLPEDIVTESLVKKSEKTGIAFSTLKEVFDRGEYSWDESNRMTQEQFAFARVNSYIAKGKAWHMDADLREEKVVNTKLDESFDNFLEHIVKVKGGYELKSKSTGKNLGKYPTKAGAEKRERQVQFFKHQAEETQATKIRKKIEVVDRPPANQAVKTRQQEIQKKIIDESGNKPYVKSFSQTGGTEHSGWKASNKHGRVKYFGKDFKASALKHAGISEDKATDREIGTDSLVKKYKKDTPGQKSNLDESFNMAWTSGIGVTLSAADCGIQIKGGFSLHPDVIEQMAEIEEDVRTADVKGEIVAGHKETRIDPKTGKQIIVNVPAHVSKGKLRRKIIGSGDVHDGEQQ